MWLLKFLRKIRRNSLRYSPSIKILISKARLIGNLREYQNNYPKLLFAPVLKSNAYGHGLVEVGEILKKENVPFLVVDSLPEAIILRNNGIRSEILVIGHTKPDNISNSKLRGIAFTITSLEQLQGLTEVVSSKVQIHLKVDTGMHRQGITEEQINKSIEIIKQNRYLNLVGVCSHFADADGPDDTFTKSQIEKWGKVVLQIKKEFSVIKYFHISATAGVFYNKQVYANVVRLGIGLYGIHPSPSVRLNLKPVLVMQSVVSSIKRLKAGEYIGYNATHRIIQDSTVATVSAGYYEGVDRRLSNCGFFQIMDKYCPIVGRVSMNITSIDVTNVPNVKFGDSVVIVSDNADDKNSVENIAKLANTIPWEILVHIPQHLRRIVV